MRWMCVLTTIVHLGFSVLEAMGSAEPAGPPTTHLVSNIDVENFGAETLRIGDLTADGAPELLFVQSVRATRQITCLTATGLDGDILWQVGEPSDDNGFIYADLPVQIYDWDHDGYTEVMYVRQARYAEPPWDGRSVRERADRYEGHATLVILDGRTGREKGTLKLPAPADDCFIFADLTGRGRREDLVVKDRYWNMWGVAHDGRVFWKWTGSTGHFPAIADVDNDGRDEVFVGYALIDDDGDEIFSKDPKGSHQDACWILKAPDETWRLLFGNTGMHCLAADGRPLWEHALGEAQHVVAGRYRSDSPVQIAVVDRTPDPTHRRDANAWAMLYLYDLEGREIWRRKQEPGAWAIATLTANWSGFHASQGLFVYGHGPGRPAAMIDGDGNVVDTFPMQYHAYRTDEDRREEFYGLVADVWGGERDEVILFGSRGACIYANARPLEKPTLYNETLYPGM